ncbi:hypothetical protein SLE2022_277180 [Rubroshorea leprosula]
MPAKLLHSLSDDNPDLQEQIGCINGLFQHFLSSRRVISQNHKRLPPGPNGSHDMEPKSASDKKTVKNLKKGMKEKPRASTESSRTSISSTSSCSSSYSSSADHNITFQTPQLSLNHTNFPETPTWNFSRYRSNVTLPLSQCLDLRDVVKDSIHREARGLSIRTATKQESGRKTLKYIDSPRPLQSPRSAKTRDPSHNESFRVLAKVQEAPRTSKERKDACLAITPKDAPRLSYDERISHDTIKIKLKELPRLSLDSRENSMKSNPPGEMHRKNGNSNDMENQPEEPESYRRPSSIVAKLMGLDALPNSMTTNGNQTRNIKTCLNVKDQSPRTDDNKQNLVSSASGKANNEPISPHLRRPASAKTPITSKCPIEPAPWKQPDLNKGKKPASKCKETPAKALNTSLTVYGEIEERQAQLEFERSGKDLRALKQILNAMQKSKQMLESRKGDQASNFDSQKKINTNPDKSSKFANLRNLEANTAFSARNKGTSSPRKSRTAAVVMKPAKLVERAGSPASSASTTDSLSWLRTSDSTNPRREKVGQQSAKESTTQRNHLRDSASQLYPTEKNTVRSPRLIQASKLPPSTSQRSGMSTDTISLKREQKRLEMEKQFHSTATRSDQTTPRRLPSRQQLESSTPYQKTLHKSPNLQQYDDQVNEISSSVQSETNMSLASSTVDHEVTNANKSSKTTSNFFQQQNEKCNNPAVRLIDDGSTAEPLKVVLEQPSPVSVLDATFHGDESPSPVKKISNAFKDDGCLNPDETQRSSMNSKDLPDCRSPRKKHDYRKVENIQHLFQKGVHMESAKEESIIKEILPYYNRRNPDHKYISEILLASNIHRELESSFTTFQFHPSGHPINPNLFLALEQTKATIGLSNDKRKGPRIKESEAIQKDHRKLIFDAVNDILASKLPKEGFYREWLSPNKLADRRLGGQQLLRDLCTEIDCLYANNSYCNTDEESDGLKGILSGDLMHQSVEWTVFQSEIPWVVLHLERLIFKDLITEVIRGVAANL